MIYHYNTLHPFSLAEMLTLKNRVEPFQEINISTKNYFNDLLTLERFGGFPEVLFSSRMTECSEGGIMKNLRGYSGKIYVIWLLCVTSAICNL